MLAGNTAQTPTLTLTDTHCSTCPELNSAPTHISKP